MPAPHLISRLEAGGDVGPDVLRDFLERLVEASATRAEVVVGEAEPGRYLLVSAPLAPDVMKVEIDAGVALVLERLGRHWPEPHVTDFGLREMYAKAREPWLARRGFEALVKENKLGIVTIFCHDWVYDVCSRVARDLGLEPRTPLEEYLHTGRIALRAKAAFRLDVFANLREMAANFDPIDHLIAKVLVLGEIGESADLAAKLVGVACERCGAFVPSESRACPSCEMAVRGT